MPRTLSLLLLALASAAAPCASARAQPPSAQNSAAAAQAGASDDGLERGKQMLAQAGAWREQAETLRIYGRRPGESAPADIYSTNEVTTKAVILFKPEPSYTEEARQDHVSGVVRLRAVLGADGQVRNIVAVKR